MSTHSRSIKSWVIAGLALLVIATAAILTYNVAFKKNPAEEYATEFLTAVVNGESQAPYEYLFGTGKTAVVDYSAVENRPTRFELGETYEIYDGNVVPAIMTFEDGHQEQYELVVIDTETGPQIEQDSLPMIHIQSDEGYTLQINGQDLRVNDTSRFRVLPGTYHFSGVSSSGATEVSDTVVAITGGNTVELVNELTSEGETKVIDASQEYLRTCTEITDPTEMCDLFAIRSDAVLGSDSFTFTWVEEPVVTVRSANLNGADNGDVILNVQGGTADITFTFGADQFSHRVENYFGDERFPAGGLQATMSGNSIHVGSR